jgi:hypothetical protein
MMISPGSPLPGEISTAPLAIRHLALGGHMGWNAVYVLIF